MKTLQILILFLCIGSVTKVKANYLSRSKNHAHALKQYNQTRPNTDQKRSSKALNTSMDLIASFNSLKIITDLFPSIDPDPFPSIDPSLSTHPIGYKIGQLSKNGRDGITFKTHYSYKNLNEENFLYEEQSSNTILSPRINYLYTYLPPNILSLGWSLERPNTIEEIYFLSNYKGSLEIPEQYGSELKINSQFNLIQHENSRNQFIIDLYQFFEEENPESPLNCLESKRCKISTGLYTHLGEKVEKMDLVLLTLPYMKIIFLNNIVHEIHLLRPSYNQEQLNYDITENKIYPINKSNLLSFEKIHSQENTFNQIDSSIFNGDLKEYLDPKEIYGHQFLYSFKGLKLFFNRNKEVSLTQVENQNFYRRPQPNEPLRELEFFSDSNRDFPSNTNFLFNGDLIVVSSESGEIETFDSTTYNALEASDYPFVILNETIYLKPLKLKNRIIQKLNLLRGQINMIQKHDTLNIQSLKNFIEALISNTPEFFNIQTKKIENYLEKQKEFITFKAQLIPHVTNSLNRLLIAEYESSYLPIYGTENNQFFNFISTKLNQLSEKFNSNNQAIFKELLDLHEKLKGSFKTATSKLIVDLFTEASIQVSLNKLLTDLTTLLDENITTIPKDNSTFLNISESWTTSIGKFNDELDSFTSTFYNEIKRLFKEFITQNNNHFILSIPVNEFLYLIQNPSPASSLKLETLLSSLQPTRTDNSDSSNWLFLYKINNYYKINLKNYGAIKKGHKFLFNINSAPQFKTSENQTQFFYNLMSFLNSEEIKSRMDFNKLIGAVEKINNLSVDAYGKINKNIQSVKLSMLFSKESLTDREIEIPAPMNEMSLTFKNIIGINEEILQSDLLANFKFTVNPTQENILSHTHQVQTKNHIIDADTFSKENLENLFWLKIGGLIEIRNPVKIIDDEFIEGGASPHTLEQKETLYYATIRIPEGVTSDKEIIVRRQMQIKFFTFEGPSKISPESYEIKSRPILKLDIGGLSVFVNILDDGEDDVQPIQVKQAKIIGIQTILSDVSQEIGKMGGLLLSKNFCQTTEDETTEPPLRVVKALPADQLDLFFDGIAPHSDCYYKYGSSYYLSRENIKLKIEINQNYVKALTVFDENEMGKHNLLNINFADKIPTHHKFNPHHWPK